MASVATLESKLYDLNCAARTVRNLSVVLRDRISGSTPEPSSAGPAEVSRPTAHGTVDEAQRLVNEAIATLNGISLDFGISQDMGGKTAMSGGSLGR